MPGISTNAFYNLLLLLVFAACHQPTRPPDSRAMIVADSLRADTALVDSLLREIHHLPPLADSPRFAAFRRYVARTSYDNRQRLKAGFKTYTRFMLANYDDMLQAGALTGESKHADYAWSPATKTYYDSLQHAFPSMKVAAGREWKDSLRSGLTATATRGSASEKIDRRRLEKVIRAREVIFWNWYFYLFTQDFGDPE